MSKLISKARAGVTLVELLVVILIVTILSVSLLPLLKPYIVKAQYAAEPVPVLGNIRTQIGLFQYEKNYLPGMVRLDNGSLKYVGGEGTGVKDMQSAVQNIPGFENGGKGGDSTLAEKTALQTFVGAQKDEKSPVSYKCAIIDTFGNVTKDEGSLGTYSVGDTKVMLEDGMSTIAKLGAIFPSWSDEKNEVPEGEADPAADFSYHFAKDIRIDYQDLTGKRMKPTHIQYRAIFGGYQSGAYAYVIGVFGDDNGLAAGTGYAVIEIVNPAAEVKYVGTWERYKTVSGDAGQLVIMDAQETKTITESNPQDALKANLCWIGNPSKYLDAKNSENVKAGIEELRKAGWEF